MTRQANQTYISYFIDNLVTIKQDQDSWKGGSGSSDSKPLVSIFGGDEIVCCRRRQKCAGVHVCTNVDTELLKDRRELNPKSLEDVIKAQVESRMNKTDSAAKRTLMYLFYFAFSVKFSNIANIQKIDSSLSSI